MRTVGINPLDNTFRSGHFYGATPENLPRIGGQTGAGAVVASKSEAFNGGNRVFVRRPGFGIMTDGHWREVGASPPARLSLIPADIGEDQAAAYLAGAGLRRLVSNNLAQFAGLHWCRPCMRVNWRSTRTKEFKLKGEAIMATQTLTKPKQNETIEDKVKRLQQLYADAPQYARTALENSLKELASFGSKPRARMESAGRAGSRQGKVSELTLIAPFAPGGAARLRALLQLRDGSFDDTDRVGTVHDMRFVFLDNDTKLLFATAYDGDFDPYIDDFATKITDQM